MVRPRVSLPPISCCRGDGETVRELLRLDIETGGNSNPGREAEGQRWGPAHLTSQIHSTSAFKGAYLEEESGRGQFLQDPIIQPVRANRSPAGLDTGREKLEERRFLGPRLSILNDQVICEHLPCVGTVQCAIHIKSSSATLCGR